MTPSSSSEPPCQATQVLRRGTARCGADRDGTWLELERPDRREVLRLPKWSCVGGMELIPSPDQQWLVLFLHSGQSSQGYELVALEPTLKRVSGLREVHGHGDAPAFSRDGSWVASLIDCDHRLRGSGQWFEEEQDDDAQDRVIVEWARVYFQRPGEDVQHFAVGVEVPRSLDVDTFFDWPVYDALRFVDGAQLELRFPWGETARVQLPRTEPFTGRPLNAGQPVDGT